MSGSSVSSTVEDENHQPNHHLVQELLESNSKLTKTLFRHDDIDKRIFDENNDVDDQAAKLRRHIQLTFSPYAPTPKRRRCSNNLNTTDVSQPTTTNDNTNQSKQCDDEHNNNIINNSTNSNNKLITTTTNNNKMMMNNPISTTTAALVRASRLRTEALQRESISERIDHSKWHCYRIMSGHLGWVRTIAFDASNEWFATGSADRTIKIWDSASGRLKLTLTGHVASVRAICISSNRPYLFSAGEDKTVKCWDLEQNKVIRNYHGHLSGVYCATLHPTLDILCTGGRDSTLRVWDMRTRLQVRLLGGHKDTVNSVISRDVNPQFISASVDSTIRMWDLLQGKCITTLTNHKKGVRALVNHPAEFSFASASADNVKTWSLPNGLFMRNFNHNINTNTSHGQSKKQTNGDIFVDNDANRKNTLINALAVNHDGVLVSGADNGKLSFWDYKTASRFQSVIAPPQPGSLSCESGIHSLAFDMSGSRLVTGQVDKTIRMYKPEE